MEHVLDGALRRDLKQMVRRQPSATLLEVRGEAIRWEQEGLPGGVRGRSHSVPSALGFQCGIQDSPSSVARAPPAEMVELKELLKCQQEQLKSQQEQLQQLAHSISRLQPSHQRSRSPRKVWCAGVANNLAILHESAMGHVPFLCLIRPMFLPHLTGSSVRRRKTSGHRTAEPQFGGVFHWLTGPP